MSDHTPWPLRNSKVFHSLNAVMERYNDLTELVHTIHDFRYMYTQVCVYTVCSICIPCRIMLHSELEAVGVVSGGVTTSEAVIGDIYTQFTAAMQVFSSSWQVKIAQCSIGY